MQAGKNIPVLLTLLLMAALYYASCTKPGNIELPATPAKLVLHGYIGTGDTFQIALGRTFKSQGQLVYRDDTFVENGWAVLYEGGTFLDSLHWDSASKRYIASHAVATPGKTYIIKAGAQGFENVESGSYAPRPVFLTNFARTRNTRKDAQGIWLDDLSLKFNDPAAENNFYLASLYLPQIRPSCIFTYDPAVERYTPDVMAFQDAFCIEPTAIMYSDRTFNGRSKEITLSLQSGALDSVFFGMQLHRPYLTRYTVTEEYYRYFLTNNTGGGGLAEEGPIFTSTNPTGGNVKNGYGLFTIFSAVTDTIR